ncbi:Cloroperoxidase, partial [Aureobasidium melanogenum]
MWAPVILSFTLPQLTAAMPKPEFSSSLLSSEFQGGLPSDFSSAISTEYPTSLPSSLPSIVAGQIEPILDPHDPRYLNWVPAGPNDSRGPCPALNSLANHGFLPHDGKNLNVAQLVLALFQGLGVSPEVSGVIGLLGALSSTHPLSLSFDLHDLSRHLFYIEHDDSFSRQDCRIGNCNDFNVTLWQTALDAMGEGPMVDAFDLGRGKSARITSELTQNPEDLYGPRAAGFGAIEAGFVLTAMGGPSAIAPLKYVRIFFEEERLPWDEGWRPFVEATNVATVTDAAVLSLAADSNLLPDAARVVIDTPSELWETVIPPDYDLTANLTALLTSIGFSALRVFKIPSS